MEPQCLFRSERIDTDETEWASREFSKFFWWSKTGEGTETPENNPSAFSKIVFGTDTSPSGAEHVLSQYNAMFDANHVPESARKLILGGTLSKIFGLPA